MRPEWIYLLENDSKIGGVWTKKPRPRDDDRLPSRTMMYFHDGITGGPRRRPKEAVHLQNGDGCLHLFDRFM